MSGHAHLKVDAPDNVHHKYTLGVFTEGGRAHGLLRLSPREVVRVACAVREGHVRQLQRNVSTTHCFLHASTILQACRNLIMCAASSSTCICCVSTLKHSSRSDGRSLDGISYFLNSESQPMATGEGRILKVLCRAPSGVPLESPLGGHSLWILP